MRTSSRRRFAKQSSPPRPPDTPRITAQRADITAERADIAAERAKITAERAKITAERAQEVDRVGCVCNCGTVNGNEGTLDGDCGTVNGNEGTVDGDFGTFDGGFDGGWAAHGRRDFCSEVRLWQND